MSAHLSPSDNPASLGRPLAWLSLLSAWAVILFVFREDVLLVVESWEKLPSHAHGYVVLLVVAFFSWKRMPFIHTVAFSPSIYGVAAFLLSAFSALVGLLVSAAVVVQFSTVFLMIVAVWAILGYQAFKAMIGPLAFLFFAIPFGHDTLPTLMDWTADATVAALRLSGIPVFQQDRHFIIPSGSWAVVEACAGIRYLFTAFFIGTIYAYVTYQNGLKRVAFVVVILGSSLFANWLRAYIIVLVAHLTNNEWGHGMSHLTLGWIIFGIVIFTAFWIGSYWQEHAPMPPTEIPPANTPRMRTLVATGIITLIAWGLPQINDVLASNAGNRADAPLLNFDASLHDLERTEARRAQIVPAYAGASATHQSTYRLGEVEVLLHVAYYRNQSQGKELINVHNQMESLRNWDWTGHRHFELTGAPIGSVHTEKFTQGDTVALAARIYWIGSIATQSSMKSKLLQVLNMLIGRGDDGAAIIISASSATEHDSHHALKAFIEQHLIGILNDLDKARETP